jgi:hypothetical protein
MNRDGKTEPEVAEWIRRVLGYRGPLGFQAGDENLYRYVKNGPLDYVDPSGEVGGTTNHSYPLYLGGSANQPLVRLLSHADHVAFHRFLSARGFPYGRAGRQAWERLTARQQQALLIRAMRVANVPNHVIRANIGAIMQGANPGVRTPRVYGAPGGLITLGTGVAAITYILTNPELAGATEIDRSWRGWPGGEEGEVQLGEAFVLREMPSALNPFGSERILRTWYGTEWIGVGEMTVAEARELEGLESIDYVGSIVGYSERPSFGHYWQVERSTVVRFTPLRPTSPPSRPE